MASRPQPASPSAPGKTEVVLGRSAATGRYVMKPATKVGAITVRDASKAVLDLQKRSK